VLRRKARRVKFAKVNILEFNRVLGRASVPDEGGFQLGLGDVLLDEREVSVQEFEAGQAVKSLFQQKSERERRELLEMRTDDPLCRAEAKELTSIRKSRKRCVCPPGCLCNNKSCPCVKEGIQCYDDGAGNSCGCTSTVIGCCNPEGMYRYDEEQVYYARRDKLEEVKHARKRQESRIATLYGNLSKGF